jgi:hypothetical protein
VKPGATATVDFAYTGNEKPAADSASIRDVIVPERRVAIPYTIHAARTSWVRVVCF